MCVKERGREKEREREYWVLASILISSQSSAVKVYDNITITVHMAHFIGDLPQRVAY